MDGNYFEQLKALGITPQQMGGGPKPLVEFKAGRMNYDGKMVTPDRRRGLIRVVKDAHGMTTFQFLDADSHNPIDSFFVFPDEAKFEKVHQTKDRVYLLEMRETKQRFFYWVQVSIFVANELMVCVGGRKGERCRVGQESAQRYQQHLRGGGRSTRSSNWRA